MTLKTDRIEKNRKFLFWTLNHQKVIVIDRVFNQNGTQVLSSESVFISSMDATDTKKFRRIKIIDDEIWVFHHNKNYAKGFIKRYDFCGNFLSKKDWSEKPFEDF